MKFVSLIDAKTGNIITVDADKMILRFEVGDLIKETRLKAYYASIIYELFIQHPKPLTYNKITQILKYHNLVMTDQTRMHRKLSEIRVFIEKFHLNLGNIIINSRGVGYSLPLTFKNLHQIELKENENKFKNNYVNKVICELENLIDDSINLIRSCKVIKHSMGYIICRNNIKDRLVNDLILFNKIQKIILKEIRMHEAEFIFMRIEYILCKIKTYIGFARVSEYPISIVQWHDWFKQEIYLHFEELKKLIKFAEII